MMYARKKAPNHARRNAILGVIVLFLAVMVVVPRWRHATACTLTGGRWTSKEILPYLATGCRVKSRTAGKQCTGQLRDECDRSLCDLSLRPTAVGRSGSGGGACPAYWVKNGYDNKGTFWSY